jgi:hypothetical protein
MRPNYQEREELATHETQLPKIYFLLFYPFYIAGVRTIFAASSCHDLVTLQGTTIVSGHFDKKVRLPREGRASNP